MESGSAAFDPDRGFLLNGEKMMMKGVCLHHDGGELGAAARLESWKRRFMILKELGVNALRLAHNPHAPEVLDLCDQMGFLVIDEMYDKWEEAGTVMMIVSDSLKPGKRILPTLSGVTGTILRLCYGVLETKPWNNSTIRPKGVAWYTRLMDLVKSIDSYPNGHLLPFTPGMPTGEMKYLRR